MARPVFISYSTRNPKNKAAAKRICLTLETAGVACWIAPRDVPPGMRWAAAITAAIKACRAMVLIFDHRSNATDQVLSEVCGAFERGIPIYVFRIEDLPPSDALKHYLQVHHWIDAFTSPLSRHIERLVAELSQTRKPSRAKSSQPAKPPKPPRKVHRPCAIGIDVGSTNIYACVTYLDGKEPTTGRAYREPVRRGANGFATEDGLLNQVKAIVERIRKQERLPQDALAGVGIAVAGQVNVKTGTLIFAPNLGVRNVPFRNDLERKLGMRIRVDNDARCATRCELYLGTGKDHPTFVCVFVGTGVGSGIVINGKIHRGGHFCAGEVGHSKLDAEGPRCNCGQRGCLEVYVSGPGITRRAQEKAVAWAKAERKTLLQGAGPGLDPREVARLAFEERDEAAIEVVEETAHDLGRGLANYINIIDPDAVVLGGGIIKGFYRHMSGTVARTIRTQALEELSNASIVQSSFLKDGAAIGAAYLFHPKEDWPFDRKPGR